MWDTLERWDWELFIFLNNLGVEQFDSFWLFVTKIEYWGWLYLLFFLFIIKWYSSKKAIVVILFTITSFVFTYGLSYLIKHAVARTRPNNIPDLENLIRVLQNPTDFSFFSGHASVSFAVAVFVILSLRSFSKWVYLFLIWPILFSISRIYVGVHFPSDIIVGMLMGVIIGWSLFRFQKQILG